jgi:ferredoxin
MCFLGRTAPAGDLYPSPVGEPLRVWVDQQLCTGDGLCVQYAPEVFEFDVDGLAYVKGEDGELRTAPGDRVGVPEHLRLDVLDSAKECPGECIHVEDGSPEPAE